MNEYPLAGPELDGLRVTGSVPDQMSICSSLDNYKVLKGIRAVPMDDFSYGLDNYYAADDQQRCCELAEEIQFNGYIDPLIVVIDAQGPYVLEGNHRLVALGLLGKKYFPAKVVLDLNSEGYGREYSGHGSALVESVDLLSLYEKGGANYMAQISAMLDELMPVLGHDLPRPEIRIINQARNVALGENVWRYSTESDWCDENTTINLQKSILGHEESLKRVLAHELCHHAQNLVHNVPRFKKLGPKSFVQYQRVVGRRQGHGQEWLEFVNKFNAKYGANFVTEKSDQQTVIEQTKPFFLLLINKNGRVMYQSAYKLGKNAIPFLRDLVLYDSRAKPEMQFRMMMSKERAFSRGASIGGDGWSVFQTGTAPDLLLQQAWHEAKPVPDVFNR